MPYLSFLVICLFWGTSFILMDRAGQAFGPAAIGAGRMAGGAITLGLYCYATRQRARLTARNWRDLALVAVLANAVPFVVQPLVMQRAGEHGFFGMLVTLVPLMTIAASALVLGQWPSRRQWVGVLGGLACAAVLTWDGSTRGIAPATLALSLCVPASYAFGNTYLKWKLDRLPTAPLSTAFLALGALAVLPTTLPPVAQALSLGGPAEPRSWPLAIASLVLLGAGSTGVAILMFVHLIKTQGPLFAGMVTYVIPVIALAWGQFDRELLTGPQLAAIGGMLSMVAVTQWGAATPPSPPASEPLA